MSLTVFLPLFAGIFQLIVSAGAPPCSVFLVQIALTLSYGCVWGSLGSFLLNLLTIGSVDQSIIVYRIYSWSSIAGVELGLSLLFDYIAIIMSFTVLTVSICVQWYSVYYMRLDPHFNRFLVYLSWFTFCMLLLVSAEDLLQFFIGWEAVGLCSYILISFWYTRVSAVKAAAKAVYVNRIGDFAFFMAMALLFVDFGTLNLYEISFISLFLKPYFIVLIPPKYGIFLVYFTNVEVICICLFIAVMSKSAQFGLHMWLPDAMEGPTPVSALIHAATMVTAGVYLMVRLAALFMLAPAVLDFAIIVGALTMIFGATTAFSQSDIKKIIAFSTCSQLGYMIVACGLAHFSVAFFHLVTHAFFKALLFLCAGIIIHSVDGEQDVRRLGAMRNQFPLVYVSFAIASAALMGIPFFSGYYSKDLIIGLACFTQTWVAYFAGDMAVHAAWFTSMYSMKLLLCVFWTPVRSGVSSAARVHVTASVWYALPLIVLAILSITSGWLLKDALAGPGTPLFPSPVADLVTNSPNTLLRVEWAPVGFKIWTMSAGLLAAVIAFCYLKLPVFVFYGPIMNNWLRIYFFLFYRWFTDLIAAHLVSRVFIGLHENLFKVQQSLIDIVSIELFLNGVLRGSILAKAADKPARISHYLQKYFVCTIVLYIFLAFLVF